MLRHPGEEVDHVLEGEIEIHTEHYAPVRLAQGDCAYFDSTMGYAFIAAGKKDALVFWVFNAELMPYGVKFVGNC